ncbi:MAG: ABC transporter ATP-binding protein [Gemmatimonadaceae bacterium]
MISFESVTVRYHGAASPAVDGASFSAANGGITALVGPNGSGKSTVVRALLGREPLESGRILLDGIDRASLKQRELARRVAVVPQREDAVFPLEVREYVALGRYPYSRGLSSSPDDARAIQRAVERAEIAGLLERRTDELSGGEWQRVRVARALAQETGMLVLDEPTTFLDIAHEMSLLELVHSLAAGGMAVLMVSHQLNLVARFASRMVLLSRGRVVADGAPREVMDAATLEAVYDWPIVISRDAASGAPVLLPLRKG